jgi:hypothetical protein
MCRAATVRSRLRPGLSSRSATCVAGLRASRVIAATFSPAKSLQIPARLNTLRVGELPRATVTASSVGITAGTP